MSGRLWCLLHRTLDFIAYSRYAERQACGRTLRSASTFDNRCALFGMPERPQVCVNLRPTEEMCQRDSVEALAWLTWLERETA